MSEQCEFCGKMRNDGLMHQCQSVRAEKPEFVHRQTYEVAPLMAPPSKTTFSYLKVMGSVELVIRARDISRLIDLKQDELKEINRLLEKNS